MRVGEIHLLPDIFFSSFFGNACTHAPVVAPLLCAPFFSTRGSAPAASGAPDPSVRMMMMMMLMMIHRRAAGVAAALGATLGGFLVGEVGGFIQNYLVFSLSSSSFFLLSPLALGSVSCAARNSVQAWKGFKNKQEKTATAISSTTSTLTLKVIRGYLLYVHNPKSVRSRSSPSSPQLRLCTCGGFLHLARVIFRWWEPLPI